ncbi:MAG: hypothetical protein NVSMB57_14770 [Actinomycetota bacterium]
MNPEHRFYELPHDDVFVRAAPEICFQVVLSGGRVIERRDNGDRLVAFEATVGGKKVVTTELVRPQKPDRIHYEWIDGPLPAVEETITIVPADDGATLHYEGRFDVNAPWLLRPLMRRVVAKKFSRAVHEHLVEAKSIAELRASRSRLYPRTD